jgi:hypothetical protein
MWLTISRLCGCILAWPAFWTSFHLGIQLQGVFTVCPGIAASSLRKPASAGTSHNNCNSQGSDKNDTLINLLLSSPQGSVPKNLFLFQHKETISCGHNIWINNPCKLTHALLCQISHFCNCNMFRGQSRKTKWLVFDSPAGVSIMCIVTSRISLCQNQWSLYVYYLFKS